MGNVARIGDITAAIGVVVVCGILIAVASWWQRHYVETGWVPGGQS